MCALPSEPPLVSAMRFVATAVLHTGPCQLATFCLRLCWFYFIVERQKILQTHIRFSVHRYVLGGTVQAEEGIFTFLPPQSLLSCLNFNSIKPFTSRTVLLVLLLLLLLTGDKRLWPGWFLSHSYSDSSDVDYRRRPRSIHLTHFPSLGKTLLSLTTPGIYGDVDVVGRNRHNGAGGS